MLGRDFFCNSISDVFENHTLMKRYASQKIIAAIIMKFTINLK